MPCIDRLPCRVTFGRRVVRPCHRGGSQLLGLGVSPAQGPRPYTSPAFIVMKAASSPGGQRHIVLACRRPPPCRGAQP